MGVFQVCSATIVVITSTVVSVVENFDFDYDAIPGKLFSFSVALSDYYLLGFGYEYDFDQQIIE